MRHITLRSLRRTVHTRSAGHADGSIADTREEHRGTRTVKGDTSRSCDTFTRTLENHMSKSTDVEYNAVIKQIARKNGGDETKAGKAMRSRIRANFPDVSHPANWKALHDARKVNRDGNRYPRTMPRHVAEFLVTGDKSKLRDTSKARKPRKVRNTAATSTPAPAPVTNDAAS
jgi:hypothetical protein